MTESAPSAPTALDVLWRRVLELAARGRFSVSPNPRVGAVVVDASGNVVGEGWHERAGGPLVSGCRGARWATGMKRTAVTTP